MIELYSLVLAVGFIARQTSILFANVGKKRVLKKESNVLLQLK